ncbi:MAG: hypothetical protein MZV70_43285 [Desulfobacterales bacterium]|nr:hypothetical protein [Desulfobacterales bacterium]
MRCLTIFVVIMGWPPLPEGSASVSISRSLKMPLVPSTKPSTRHVMLQNGTWYNLATVTDEPSGSESARFLTPSSRPSPPRSSRSCPLT